jgi:melibiose permease/lactose/raffinose/galactose permease
MLPVSAVEILQEDLVVMTVLPFLFMYASYVLYRKKYILDEAEYERICTELEARQKEKTV